MLFHSVEAVYFGGVEDRSFVDKEGKQVNYYRYNFLCDDEQGTPLSLGSGKPLLAQGIKKLDVVYPIIELSFSKEGPRVRLENLGVNEDVEQ